MLRDEGSKHGTYFWIDRNRPIKLELHDVFLINKMPLVVTRRAGQPHPLIEFSYDSKPVYVSDPKKLFLIGSHPKCDLVVAPLYQFEVCVNLSTCTIFTNLDEEEAAFEHGLWLKLRGSRQNYPLEPGALLMADPYIFRVSS